MSLRAFYQLGLNSCKMMNFVSIIEHLQLSGTNKSYFSPYNLSCAIYCILIFMFQLPCY